MVMEEANQTFQRSNSLKEVEVEEEAKEVIKKEKRPSSEKSGSVKMSARSAVDIDEVVERDGVENKTKE